MQTLKQFNADKEAVWHNINERNKPHPNGIECPSCKKELWDSNPNITLSSNPPQKNIHCPACGYNGYRLA